MLLFIIKEKIDKFTENLQENIKNTCLMRTSDYVRRLDLDSITSNENKNMKLNNVLNETRRFVGDLMILSGTKFSIEYFLSQTIKF